MPGFSRSRGTRSATISAGSAAAGTCRAPALAEGGLTGLVTLERCCLDFDGGGPADDGLLVIGVPPDRVVMAAIFERRGHTRLPLR